MNEELEDFPIQSEPLKVGVSLSQKVNLGNYESAEAWVSVSGVTAHSTEEDIDAALEVGKIAYDRIRLRMKDKIYELRKAVYER